MPSIITDESALMYFRTIPVIAFLSTATSVLASEFYVGGQLGASNINDSASTAETLFSTTNTLPNELSINGRYFDSTETAWGVVAGWNAADWFAIEIGYTDLGSTGEKQRGFLFYGPTPIPTFDLPPSGVGGGFGFAVAANTNIAALNIEEWSVGAKFRKSLISRLAANWSIGITRAAFDSQGSITVHELVSVNPLILNPVIIPFASPADETGFTWGLGFAWEVNKRFSLDLGYRKHDTQVIEVESITLQVLGTL